MKYPERKEKFYTPEGRRSETYFTAQSVIDLISSIIGGDLDVTVREGDLLHFLENPEAYTDNLALQEKVKELYCLVSMMEGQGQRGKIPAGVINLFSKYTKIDKARVEKYLIEDDYEIIDIMQYSTGLAQNNDELKAIESLRLLMNIYHVLKSYVQADDKEKREAWSLALGLMKIDTEPSQEFLEEVEKEIRGEITIDEMLLNWEKRHKRPKK